MTVSIKKVKETYNGDGSNTTFAIPFDYQSGEASDVTVVTHIDSGGNETELTEGTDYQLTPAGDDPTDVDTSLGSSPFGAPASDEKLRVERVTELIQETDYDSAGPSTPYQPTALENSVDQLIRIAQELNQGVIDAETASASIETISGVLLGDWAAATEYKEDQLVYANLRLYRATTDHTSGGDFETDLFAGKWEKVITQGIEGPKGPKGDAGPTGPAGPAGSDGADGADGADGVFSQIASQSEAEAGTDNTKGMTPLRTKQAIDEQVPNLTVVTDLETEQTSQGNEIDKLKTRVSSLESFSDFAVGRFAGSQKLKNNHGPQELRGRFAPDAGEGGGDPLERSSTGTSFSKIYLYIKRESDGVSDNYRFSSFDLIMQFVDGVWYIGRVDTVQLVTSLELDGVTLTVSTSSGVGKVSYQTDNMESTDDDIHFENSVIKWWGQEIPEGV